MKQIKLDLRVGFQSLDLSAKEAVKTSHIGNYRSTFKGRGLEFDSYRKYDPNNDDATMIDRLASARAGSFMVRQFIEERNMEVFFIIDVSNSMILTSQPKLKCEYTAELVSSLSYIILNSNDNVGFALFNDKIMDFALPGNGIPMHTKIINTLSKAENYGGGFDLKGAIDFALGLIGEGSLLVVVSDFIGMEDGWEESIRFAANKFSVIGIMVRDPIDRKIPTGMGQIAISDPYARDNIIIDPNIIKADYEDYVKKEEAYINQLFKENDSDFVILQTDESFIEKIVEMFKMREKRYM